MKSLVVAAVLLGSIAPCSGGQGYDFSKVVWPPRVAVGIHQQGQIGPLSVEVTRTGWISMNLLSKRPDIYALPAPPSRMMTDAANLRRFIGQLRPLVMSLGDTNAKVGVPPKPKPNLQTISLGNGRYQMQVFFQGGRPHFSWRACGSGWSTVGPTPHELLGWLALLDTAATAAEGGRGRPPTLSRPYYSMEVSCPANPDTANVLPLPPAGMASPIWEVGAQFVVDAAGLVERNSIRLLPGVDARLGDSVRAAVSRWHFTPAEIDGTVVRQIVQMGVAIGPRPTSATLSQQVITEASVDGWVRVQHGDPMGRDVLREWYEPDSIVAFLTRVHALKLYLDTLSRDTTIAPQHLVLTAPGREPLTATLARRDHSVDAKISLPDCYGFGLDVPLGDPDRLGDAVHQARINRSSPADQTASVHEWNDVTCRAWDPWTLMNRGEMTAIWRYPVGEYPASMAATNARAEVLASFIVDTLGDVDMNSLELMPASDPRAVAEIPRTLAARRFRPARRSGRKVPQRVIEAIRFEPPPFCATPLLGPACPRLYSPR